MTQPDEPQEKPNPVAISLDSSKAHWLSVMDWAQKNLDKLDEETKEFKQALKEAEEQLFEGVPEEGWDYLTVDGKVIYTRTIKESPKRVYIEDLKAAHPDIYEELAKSKPISKVTRVQ